MKIYIDIILKIFMTLWFLNCAWISGIFASDRNVPINS